MKERCTKEPRASARRGSRADQAAKDESAAVGKIAMLVRNAAH